LRAYAEVPAAETDVAVELPTGAGKTLVGLLLAEYRRLRTRESVAYLCPTVQLAHQASSKAAEYGLDVVTLTGRHTGWTASDRTAYISGSAVAVSTYSHVFNTHPKLVSGTLVLDDAHAGENYVAKLWSVTARHDSPLFAAVLAAVADGLPRSTAERLKTGDSTIAVLNDVHLVSPLVVSQQADLIRGALAVHASEPEDENYWSAQMLDVALEHALIYFSGREMLIRPLIPPTAHHAAFSSPSQRIYMSATLGSGGELERAFGVQRIRRLSPKTESHQQGLGRRFFVVPGASREPAEVDRFICDAIEKARRALVIAPSNGELDRFAGTCLPGGVPQLGPDDVATSFEPFVVQDKAVLMLANRYDGIDLPDDACRLIVLSGLPAYAHLQERFFMDKLNARRVTSERIRARITQGAGRCTRNAQDYAAVILRDDRLVAFCAREDEIAAMHPEIQAELRFGLENSGAGADLMEMLSLFLVQDPAWLQVEKEIGEEAEDMERVQPPGTEALEVSAALEVQCWQALWRGDREEAAKFAQRAADQLGGDELSGYRTLWLYLAACWTRVVAEEEDDAEALRRADALQADAESAARMLPWAPRLRATARPEVGAAYDERAVRSAELLRRWNLGGARFEREIKDLEEQLRGTSATPFELGLRTLGEMLGFEAERPDGNAQPDGAWRIGDEIWILFEVKSEEKPTTPVSPRDVRQALSHSDWVAANFGWPEPRHTVTILVSPKTAVDPDAAVIAKNLAMCDLDTVRSVAASAIAVLRDVRSRARGQSDEQLAAMLAQQFRTTGLMTERLLGRISRRLVKNG
jgi:hypothetical protein